jgi:small subunit ribosomal protein S1
MNGRCGFCEPRLLARDTPLTRTAGKTIASGEQMASSTSANSYNPTRDDFAAMLDESFAGGNLQESSVIKGKVVAIEKDMAVIDVGLKTEGRVALREFSGPGRDSDLKVGDTVEVFLDRIENALGEAVLSRDKARREESWGKLE